MDKPFNKSKSEQHINDAARWEVYVIKSVNIESGIIASYGLCWQCWGRWLQRRALCSRQCPSLYKTLGLSGYWVGYETGRCMMQEGSSWHWGGAQFGRTSGLTPNFWGNWHCRLRRFGKLDWFGCNLC